MGFGMNGRQRAAWPLIMVSKVLLGLVVAGGLVLAAAAPAIAQQPERLTVLEMFGRETCDVCATHAAPALDRLRQEYERAGRPVLIMEHDTNNSGSRWMGQRRNRWFRIMGVTRAALPLLMLNGGLATAFGEEADYEAAYRGLIEQGLREPPQAEVSGSWARLGATTLEATVRIRNTGDEPIDPADGDALWIFAVRAQRVVHTGSYAGGVGRVALPGAIAPGQQLTVAGPVEVDGGTDLGDVTVYAVVERSLDGGRFDVVQGARLPLDTSAPTPLPTSTPEPTATPPPATLTPGTPAPVMVTIWLPVASR